MSAEGVLRPGWLRADVERANGRLKEWSEKAVPTRERGRADGAGWTANAVNRDRTPDGARVDVLAGWSRRSRRAGGVSGVDRERGRRPVSRRDPVCDAAR